MGDTLVSLPVFWRIRNAFPAAAITLLSNSDPNNPHYISARGVLPEKGIFDHWITYPVISRELQSLVQFKNLFLELRRGEFDAVIYVMTRNRTAFQLTRDRMFFASAGISNIIGMRYLRENSLPVHSPRPSPQVESESNFLWKCLSFDDFPNAEDQPSTDMRLNTDEISAADSWLNKVCEDSGSKRKLLAVAPGSKWESKVWHEDRFAEVVERLIAEQNIFPIVFGGAEDSEKAERLLARWKIGANAAGVLNIREAAAALRQCRLYLGNDTGTMHLAAAVGTPCVAVFAAVDWAGRWEPFGTQSRTFRKNVECEGCHSPVCFNDHKCLKLVETDEVFKACIQVLHETGR